jgi:hypothetical protein
MRYRLPQEGSARLEVFDLAGRRVLSRGIDDRLERAGELRLDAPGLRAGMYIVRLEQLGRSATARAILLR